MREVLRVGEAVGFGRDAVIPTGQVGGALPAAAMSAAVDVELAPEEAVLSG